MKKAIFRIVPITVLLVLSACNKDDVTGKDLVLSDFNNNFQTMDIYFIADNILHGVRDNNFGLGQDVGTMEQFLEVQIPSISPTISTPYAFYSNGGPDRDQPDNNLYENTRLAVATGDGNLNLYNIPSGELLWSTYLNGELRHAPARDLYTNFLYVGNSSGSFYAVDENSGNIVWSFENPSGASFEAPEVLQTEDISDKVLATASNGEIFVFDALDGRLLWSYDTMGIISSKPLHISLTNGIESVIVVQQNGTMFRFDANTGELLWQRDLPQPTAVFSAPSLIDKFPHTRFFVPSANRRIYYVMVESGDIDWWLDTPGAIRSSVAIRIKDSDVVMSLDNEGNVYKLDMVSAGAIEWTYPINDGSNFVNSPVFTGRILPKPDGTPGDFRRTYVKSRKGIYGINSDGRLGSQFLLNSGTNTEDGTFSMPAISSPMILHVRTSEGTIDELHYPASIDNEF